MGFYICEQCNSMRFKAVPDGSGRTCRKCLREERDELKKEYRGLKEVHNYVAESRGDLLMRYEKLKLAHNKLEEQSNKDCEYLNTKCGRLEKERDELKKERDRFRSAYSQVNGLYFSLNEKKELRAENDKLKKEVYSLKVAHIEDREWRDKLREERDGFKKENDRLQSAFNQNEFMRENDKLREERDRFKKERDESKEQWTDVPVPELCESCGEFEDSWEFTPVGRVCSFCAKRDRVHGRLLAENSKLKKERDKLIVSRDEFKRSRDDLALKLFKRTGERNEAKEERDYFEGRCDIIVESCNKLKKENDKLKDRIPASVRTSKPVKACSSCVHRHVCTDYVPCLGTFVSKPLPPYRNWKLEKEF